MTIKQLRKEIEGLKKDIRPDKHDLHNERFNYIMIKATVENKDEANKEISKLFKDLTDEEKALVTIDEQPEYVQYEKAINWGNVNQAIKILNPLSKRIRDEIINHHDEALRFDTYLTNMSNDPDYPETWDDFNERFKTTKEYKWIQEVKESF